MSSFPQFPRSDKFNPALFASDTDTFTLASADLRYVRIGSDAFLSNVSCSSLTINGTLADLTPIIGVTAGIASGSKALVLDSSLNIVGINNITSTGIISSEYTNNTTSQLTYQSWSNTIGTPITVQLNMSNGGPVFGTTTNHFFRLISNNAERIRINAGGNVSIGNTNNTYKLDITGTTMIDSLKIRGNSSCPSFTLQNFDGVGGFDSGLRLAPDADALLTYQNIGIWSPAFAQCAMHISFNGQNCVHLRPQSNADVNQPMPNTGLCVGNNAIVRGGVIVSSMPLSNTNNYTPQCALRVIGNNNYLDGSYQKIAEFCNSTYGNTLTIQCSTSTGPVFFGTTTASDIRFGTANSTSMILTTTDHLLIGTSTDIAPLTVNGTSTYTVISIATNTYRYNLTNNTYSNLGGGPQSFSISAFFSSNILVNGGSVYATSDRRLKRDIKPLDFELAHYMKLEPVSYSYKNEDQTRIGLIAQDVLKVCGEMVGFSENKNMKEEQEGDPVGAQLGVDYNQLAVMNCSALKKVITELQ
jgi:hypothetical protein